MAGFLHAQPKYQVVDLLVIAKLLSGEKVHVYQHALLPDSTDPLQLRELVASGSIRALEVAA